MNVPSVSVLYKDHASAVHGCSVFLEDLYKLLNLEQYEYASKWVPATFSSGINISRTSSALLLRVASFTT